MGLNNLGLGFLFTAKDLASGIMQKLHGNLGKVEGKASGFGAAAGAAMKSFGVGLAIAGAGLGALAALGPAIEESRNLSKAIALIATESDEAVFPQEQMRDLAEKLAVQYGRLPVEQAQAMYKAVALGANNAAKAQDFLNGVNLLAVAGDADLITTTNALGGVLNAYGESFDKATSYGEAFFVAMRMGNTTIQDLSSSIGRVAPMAKGLNIPFDELIGSVSVMTNKGIQASEAVSGLKEALANIVHPSADAQKEATRLGVKFSQGALRAKGSLKAFLDDIIKSPKFTAESFSKLFTSVEGGAAVINMMSNEGKDFNAVLDAMKNKSGATKKGFEIMAATLDFQIKKFEANKAVVLGMIGKALEPLAAAALRVVNTILTAFSKAPKPLVAFLSKMFVAVATFATIVGSVLAAKAAIALFVAGLKAVGVTVGGLLATLAPVVLVVAALAAVFYGLREAYRTNLGGFADFVDNAVTKATLAFDGLSQLFASGAFSGDVMKDLNKAENSGIKQFAINVFLWVERIKNFFHGIGEGFSEGLKQLDGAIEVLKTSLSRLGAEFGFLSEKSGAAANADKWKSFGEVGSKIGDGLAQAFGIAVVVLARVGDVIRGVVEGAKKMGPAFDFAGNAFSQLGTQISNMLVAFGLMQEGTDGASNGWVALGNVLSITVGIIGAAIGVVVSVITAAVAIIGGVVEAVRNLFSGLQDIVTGIVFVIGGIITGRWSDVWKGAKLIVFGFVDGVGATLFSLVGVIAGVIDAIVGAFGKKSELQKGMTKWINQHHNNMAKRFDVTDLTGERAVGPAAAPGAPGVVSTAPGAPPLMPAAGKPLLAPPGAPSAPIGAPGATAAVPGVDPAVAAMNGHLQAIATNTQKPPQVTVLLDSEQIAAKVVTNRGGARSFNPAPIPT